MARDTAPRELLADSDVIESLGTPVVVARPPGVLSLMNRAARELTGFEAHIGDRLDQNMRIFPATDGKGRPLGESALLAALGGRESEGEATFKNFKTGEEHVVHWIARPVRGADGSAWRAAVGGSGCVPGRSRTRRGLRRRIPATR